MTDVGPLALTPSSIRELWGVNEDESHPERVFEAILWGGGVVRGALEDSRIKVEGRGFGWNIPARHLQRLVNPIPLSDNSLMRRIGQLISFNI